MDHCAQYLLHTRVRSTTADISLNHPTVTWGDFALPSAKSTSLNRSSILTDQPSYSPLQVSPKSTPTNHNQSRNFNPINLPLLNHPIRFSSTTLPKPLASLPFSKTALPGPKKNSLHSSIVHTRKRALAKAYVTPPFRTSKSTSKLPRNPFIQKQQY